MKNTFGRRRFIQGALTGAVAAAMAPDLARADVVKPAGDSERGLKLGVASYTYRKFTLEQAISMTREAGFHYINLKDCHLPLQTTVEERKAAREKCEAAGLKLLGGGVIGLKNNGSEIRRAFEYARDAGMPLIVCSPEIAALDALEKTAREFNIRAAIHNHGPTDKMYPSPLDALALIKDRDPVMGLCMDVGHTVRAGVDPVECIERCGPRLFDIHMKDETKAAKEGTATELGHGVVDVAAILKSLVKHNFPGHVGLEYEAHGDNPQPYVMECAGYLRGALAAMA